MACEQQYIRKTEGCPLIFSSYTFSPFPNVLSKLEMNKQQVFRFHGITDYLQVFHLWCYLGCSRISQLIIPIHVPLYL